MLKETDCVSERLSVYVFDRMRKRVFVCACMRFQRIDTRSMIEKDRASKTGTENQSVMRKRKKPL